MKKKLFILFLIIILSVVSVGCGDSDNDETSDSDSTTTGSDSTTSENNTTTEDSSEDVPSDELRDSTPLCLVPSTNGSETDLIFESTEAVIDASNSSEGYVMVLYRGTNSKVKLQITGSDDVTYTYNLDETDYEVFPLTADSGTYTIKVYENISGSSYAEVLSAEIDVTITNEFGPYLYPNQYVNFDSTYEAVDLAEDLASTATDDLDVVEAVYNYFVENVTYDYDKAETVESGYLPDIDDTIETGKGICFDYASAMTAMLRSQQIPTRLEIGYHGTAYHAWISTYIEDVGWVNGIIEFDGDTWTMMDPTVAASNGQDEATDFVGDGSDYTVKYVY